MQTQEEWLAEIESQQRAKNNSRRTEYYYKNRAAQLVRDAKRRAAKRGLEFTLTKEWALETYTGHCAITGIKFLDYRDRNGGGPYSPSIDRIDNTKGYTESNCRWGARALLEHTPDYINETHWQRVTRVKARVFSTRTNVSRETPRK